MKKTMKKLVAVATAAVMTFAMGVCAYAADVVTLAGSMNEWNATDMDAQFTDDDGDGILTYKTTLEAGDYEFKIIVNGTWTPDGMSNNYGINVAAATEVTFCYNPASTNTYQYSAYGEGVTVNADINRASAEGEGKDPEEIKGKLEEAAADAVTWAPEVKLYEAADAPADEPAADEPADDPAEDDTTANKAEADKNNTGDALSLSIVMIGAVAVVAFVASRKRVNA